VVVDTSLVTDHRMAFSMSPAQTVLWDQVRYSGSPSDFAWVLPVRAGARVELSTDAWLAALDATTQTVIVGPATTCGGAPSTQYEGGGGGGCGASTSASETSYTPASEDDGGGASPVQVLSQSVVGPYQSVTVRSSQGEALGAWLVTNGYEVVAGMQPVIDAYTTSGFDFIALKLRPGQGVQAMQPVRVVTPGADPTLPLRMVAAGIGVQVGLELFVLSEGRYHTQNFPDATVDFSRLAWDPYKDISTYDTLAQEALAANGGTGWLTTFSGAASLGLGYANGVNPGLQLAYQANCVPSIPLCPPVGEAGGDAGDEAGVSSCMPAITCDDLDLAMTGISRGSLWITRLRAMLPAGALGSDLVLEATASQTPVSNLHSTTKYTDPNFNPCPASNAGTTGRSSPAASTTSACSTARVPRNRYAGAVVLCLASVLAAAAGRRRRPS
jgi:hypothetical protein